MIVFNQFEQALSVSSKEISVLSQEVQGLSDYFVRHQSYNSCLELMENLAYQLDDLTRARPYCCARY